MNIESVKRITEFAGFIIKECESRGFSLYEGLMSINIAGIDVEYQMRMASGDSDEADLIIRNIKGKAEEFCRKLISDMPI